jgi:hypothetical protein
MSLRPSRRPLVDDAYSAWFNAQSRCAHALRVWSAAAPRARAAAHRAYVAELKLEEAAAYELERLQALWTGA